MRNTTQKVNDVVGTVGFNQHFDALRTQFVLLPWLVWHISCSFLVQCEVGDCLLLFHDVKKTPYGRMQSTHSSFHFPMPALNIVIGFCQIIKRSFVNIPDVMFKHGLYPVPTPLNTAEFWHFCSGC